MRRSSVITIIFLVLIIVGLVISLVVTNLPKNNSDMEVNKPNDTAVPNEIGANVDKKEEPNFIALDNKIVKDIYEILNKSNNKDFFHYFTKGEITINDFDNEDIQTMAFLYDIANKSEEKLEESEKYKMRNGKFSKETMDNAVKKMFGDVKYEPTYGYFQSAIKSRESALFEYDKEKNVYYVNSGFGGGSDIIARTAISKVEEYSDRYEVTEKMVVTEGLPYDGGYSIYPFYGTTIAYSKWIGRLSKSESENLTNSHNLYSANEYDAKLLSKYFDSATEYKHTFNKNPDGTYYWVKTEII